MRWLLLFVICPLISEAQTNDGFFLFSVADTASHWLVTGQDHVQAQVQVGETEDMFLPVVQVGSSEWMALRIPYEFLGQPMLIRISRPSGNMEEVMELQLATAVPGSMEGCYRCMAGSIIFSKARVVIDMPKQPESWELLPRRNVTAANTSFDCYDLSILQPFCAVKRN